jgi:hypothetical protein
MRVRNAYGSLYLFADDMAQVVNMTHDSPQMARTSSFVSTTGSFAAAS